MQGRPGVERIGQKEQVELAAFGGARGVHQQIEVLGSRLRLLHAPAGDMMPRPHDVNAEMHLARCFGHGIPPQIS